MDVGHCVHNWLRGADVSRLLTPLCINYTILWLTHTERPRKNWLDHAEEKEEEDAGALTTL